jgi:diguanylate cyclase
MKTIRTIRNPDHIGVAVSACAAFLRAPARPVLIGAAREASQAQARINELQHALELSQRDSIAARQQVALLMATNARLREIAIESEQEMTKARDFAYHDELTGLPNRTLLVDRFNQALVRARRQGMHLALLLLDLDGFKHVNDSLGHATGDKLLQKVATRLLSCIRGADTACRYGGDEFVLLLPEIQDQKQALRVAEKIRTRLARPYSVEGHLIEATASIGVAVYPVDGTSQLDLIKKADVAMYRAKTLANAPENRASHERAG